MTKVLTERGVMSSFRNVISVNFCRLRTLLHDEKPYGHTEKTGCWGADVYAYGDTAIVTGIAPFGNIVPSSELVSAIERQAQKYYEEYFSSNKMKYAGRKKFLLKCFIEEAKGVVP